MIGILLVIAGIIAGLTRTVAPVVAPSGIPNQAAVRPPSASSADPHLADSPATDPPPLAPTSPQLTEEWAAERFPGSRELSRRETSPTSDGTFRRERILETHFKYPLIRVVEELRRDASGEDEHVLTRTAMVADQVLMALRGDTNPHQMAAMVERSGLRILKPASTETLWVVQLPDGDLDAINRGVKALAEMNDRIAYVEPDYLFLSQATPDDPRFSEQWGLHQSTYYGTYGINAPAGWDIRSSAPGVVVAVIDSGVRHTHQDLIDNTWHNSDEIPGNGIDDDHNGVIDDTIGADFYNNDADPADDNGHGTHVAGIIGARGNNAVGVTGVAWQTQLMAVKFLNSTGVGTTSDAVRAIDYALTNGAMILNNSWSGDGFSQALRDAIARAAAAGVPFVTASGNDGRNIDATPKYPASYDLDNVVSVGGLRSAGWRFGNWGVQSVDLLAPGAEILSCSVFDDSSHQTMTGTSQSAAFVSGILALLKAEYPAQPCPWHLSRMFQATTYMSDQTDLVRTAGRVNLPDTLTGVTRPPPSIVTQPVASPAYSGGNLTISVAAGGGAPLRYQWYRNGVALNGQLGATLAIGGISPADNGLYHVVVANLAGNVTSQEVSVTVVDSPPLITRQPASMPAFAGQKVILEAAVEGSQPLSLQWEFNGVPLAGKTESQLVLENVGAANAGSYRLVAANAFGTKTSVTARLELRTHYLSRLQPAHPFPSVATYREVVFAGNKFIAFANDGTIASSGDGENWLLGSAGTTAELCHAAYGNGRYVAVGKNGVIVTSTDALNWTPAPSVTTADLAGVSFGANRFVAISGSTTLTSADGLAWTSQTVTDKNLLRIAHVGGMFLMIGDSAGDQVHTLRSADGLTWLPGVSFAGRSYLDSSSIVFFNGTWFIHDGEWLHSSADGATWARFHYFSANRLFAGPDRMYYMNDFSIGSFDPGTLQKTDLFSYYPYYDLEGLACGNGRLVAAGWWGTIFLSRNLGSFELVSHVTTSPLHGCVYADGRLLAAAHDGRILASADGRRWSLLTTLPLQSTTYLSGTLLHGNGRYVVGASNGSVWRSTDGVTWQEVPSSPAPTRFCGDYFWRPWYPGEYYRSPDGVNWTKVQVPIDEGVWHAGGKYLGFRSGANESYVSSDGISWQKGSLPPNVGSPRDLVWADGRYVVLTSGGIVLTSPDGLVWRGQTTSGIWNFNGSLDLNDLVFHDGVYAALTSSGLYLSFDAVNWALGSPVKYGYAFIPGPSGMIVDARGYSSALHFADREMRVTATAAGEGTVEIEPPAAGYRAGDIVTLRPVASPGQVFAGWDGSHAGSANPLGMTVAAGCDILVPARFKPFNLAWRQSHFLPA